MQNSNMQNFDEYEKLIWNYKGKFEEIDESVKNDFHNNPVFNQDSVN